MSTIEEHAQDITRWQRDGGKDLGKRMEAELRDDAGHGVGARSSQVPVLPAGYEAQPAGGFSDSARGRSYEFHRVYGPARGAGTRGPLSHLDESLSYWIVSSSSLSDTAAAGADARWINFERARQLAGAHLTFARFSSLGGRRNDLFALLERGEIAGAPAAP